MKCEKGWDFLQCQIGVVETKDCPTCGQKMNFTSNQQGYTNSINAMANIESNYDYFECSNYQEEWHQQAKELKKFMLKVPSKTLEELLSFELNQILTNKEPTKRI